MNWFSRIFGTDKRVEELENRVKVLEHNLSIMIQVVKNTAGAVEKISGFMQEIDREINAKREREVKAVFIPREKKEYTN